MNKSQLSDYILSMLELPGFLPSGPKLLRNSPGLKFRLFFHKAIFGWDMKKVTMIGIAFILLGCLVPTLSSASTTYAKAHRKAVAACKGKEAGDPVLFINKWNKRIKGICMLENGGLIAISERILSGGGEKRRSSSY